VQFFNNSYKNVCSIQELKRGNEKRGNEKPEKDKVINKKIKK
jgi:hypothetical protein